MNLCVLVTSVLVWGLNLATGTCHLFVEGWGPGPTAFCVLLAHDSAVVGLPEILISTALVYNTTVTVVPVSNF